MSLQVGQIVEFQGKDPPVQLGIVLAITPKGVRLLQLNRKETTVTERTVLHHTAQSKASPQDLDGCWEKARQCDEKRQRLAATINLGELHELLQGDVRPYGLLEMAGFLADAGDEDMEAALLRRLAADSFYFRQRKEGYVPVPADEVRAALEREEKRQRQEAEDQALVDDLKRAAAGTPLAELPRVAAVLESLVQIVVWGAEAQVPKRVHEILERAGLHQPRPLFAFLVNIGRFGPDEHLDLLRYKVPTAFPPELDGEASRLLARVAAPGSSTPNALGRTACGASPRVPAEAEPAAGKPPGWSSGEAPPAVVSSATAQAGRRDLRGLPTWAIDSETTRDRDDAFSLEADDRGYTLWIHVSDVAASIPRDSPLDREASRRGTTIYLPEGNIPMLPPAISENALSLSDAGDRPALTWQIRLDPEGGIQSYEIYRSLVRVTVATDYPAADGQLEPAPTPGPGHEVAGVSGTPVSAGPIPATGGGVPAGDPAAPPASTPANPDTGVALRGTLKGAHWTSPTAPILAAGVRLAGKLRERRRQAGALLVERQPELKLTLAPDGRVELGYRPGNSPTADMIMEFMVLANHLAARHCQEHDLPCLYRSQERAENLPELPAEFQPVAFFQALRFFRKTVLGATPGHHSSLGVGPYCQVTSPLRRYSDLLIQRQVTGHLDGGPVPYDAEGFQRALMAADEATRTAETIMRDRQNYWVLKFLQQELAAGRDAWPAVVVDQTPHDVVVYFELICEFRTCRRPAHDVAVGQRVTLRVKKADPFEGLFRFEILP